VVDKVLSRAEKKFHQLDTNGDGVLAGEELVGLAEWLFNSFHPGGAPLSPEKKEVETQKLLNRLDDNEDGCMSFDEFAAWFQRTCKSIERYRSGLARKKKEEAAAAVAEKTAVPLEVGDADSKRVVDKVLSRAEKKFHQLDTNGDGVLAGEELVGLAEWLFNSFHPGGAPLSPEKKEVETQKLLNRLDDNEDGCMSFDEFAAWFQRTCKSIERYRHGLDRKKRAEAEAEADALKQNANFNKPVNVPVPKGSKPGDRVKLSVYGQKISVIIPEDKGPGDVFRIMPPRFDKEAAHEKEHLEFECPEGTEPGDMVTFDYGEGMKAKKLTLLVPKGKKSGDMLKLTLYHDFDKAVKSKGGGPAPDNENPNCAAAREIERSLRQNIGSFMKKEKLLKREQLPKFNVLKYKSQEKDNGCSVIHRMSVDIGTQFTLKLEIYQEHIDRESYEIQFLSYGGFSIRPK